MKAPKYPCHVAQTELAVIGGTPCVGRRGRIQPYKASDLALWDGEGRTRDFPPVTPWQMAGFYCETHIGELKRWLGVGDTHFGPTLDATLASPGTWGRRVAVSLTDDRPLGTGGLRHFWSQKTVNEGLVRDVIPVPLEDK